MLPRSSVLALVSAAAVTACASGCAEYGIIHDGTSVSWGTTNRGVLVNGARLSPRGEGYWMPPTWEARGLHYGTEELVSLVVYASRRVRAESPGALVGVGNLSPRGGGPSRWHGSHQTGRDVDLLFFAEDGEGAPVRATAMHRYDERGVARAGEDDELRFDVERNWLMVRAMLESPIASVQWIFVADYLKQMLLDHAIERGEPMGLVLRASYILHQPSNAPPHADHFHVRIFCPRTDQSLGCRDRGWARWHKKGKKYPRRARALEAETELEELVSGPIRAPLGLEALGARDVASR